MPLKALAVVVPLAQAAWMAAKLVVLFVVLSTCLGLTVRMDSFVVTRWIRRLRQ